jgi:hypothetical protein
MAVSAKSREYTHQELRTDYTGLAGFYCPFKEVTLDYHGRQVLYVVGHAAISSSCCGISNWDYVLVPGYIVEWHKGTNDDGLPMSAVEPIQDSAVRVAISRLITSEENTERINFW